MKRTFLFSGLIVGSVAAMSVLGCSGSTAASDPTASAVAAESAPGKAPVAPQAKGHMRVVADALSQVALRPDQRAEIEQMAKDAGARHAAHEAAHAQVLQTLAAQIEAGKIDRAALQPSIDAAIAAGNAAHPADQAAMQRLHALLTPEQRAQFADALESSFHARMGAHAGAPHSDHVGHLDKWAADLKLTDDQRAQIATILKGQFMGHHAEMKEAHGKGKMFVESFKSDTFTPAPAEDVAAKANAMADHIVGVAQAVLPILTPEQRSLAATKVRARASGAEADDGAPLGGE
jgi:Spy/CpxP family protein refolding chaperone